MHAVIATGGHQMIVRPGDTIELEGVDRKVGDEVAFDRVLAVGDKIGTPVIDGAAVQGKVVDVGRGPKIYVQKFKRRKNYRRRTGFRASVYKVEITGITEG